MHVKDVESASLSTGKHLKREARIGTGSYALSRVGANCMCLVPCGYRRYKCASPHLASD